MPSECKFGEVEKSLLLGFYSTGTTELKELHTVASQPLSEEDINGRNSAWDVKCFPIDH